MKNSFLFLVLFAVLAWGAVRFSQPVGEAPSRAVLAEIMRAFAWNLEEDGKLQQPLLTSADQVGFLFDDFGKRSTYGAAYKEAFPTEFKEVGAELEAAVSAGKDAGALPLTAELRATMAAIFIAAASELD